MENNYDYILTVADVAEHFGLTDRTVRTHLNRNNLSGVRSKGNWKCRWVDVWAEEQGPIPRGAGLMDCKKTLMSKKTLAAKWNVCKRTVDRWISDGLPTRNVFGSLRIAPIDAAEWTKKSFDLSEKTA